MTNEFPECQHGKTAVAELVCSALFHGLLIKLDWKSLHPSLGVRVQVVDRADKKEEDRPEESRDHIKGVESIGDVLVGNTWSKLTWETVNFWNNVAEDSEHGNTTVLDLTELVTFESRRVPLFTDAKRVEESCNTDYITRALKSEQTNKSNRQERLGSCDEILSKEQDPYIIVRFLPVGNTAPTSFS